MQEIEAEISRLEKSNANYDNLIRLAVLYSIRDHQDDNVMRSSSRASSEFIQAISGAPTDRALEILDEHFECIKLLYPKEYNAIIERLQKIKIE